MTILSRRRAHFFRAAALLWVSHVIGVDTFRCQRLRRTAAARSSAEPPNMYASGARTAQLSLKNGGDEARCREAEGSVFGSSLLFAGTAVGAGMIALPSETYETGFIPSIVGLSLCCAFTYCTSIFALEACWLASKQQSLDSTSPGFLVISKLALGGVGEAVTALLFWLLLTAIVSAYISEGGIIVTQMATNLDLDSGVASLLFASCFAVLAIFETSYSDFFNRFFVLGLAGSFLALVGVGLPEVGLSNLTMNQNWSSVYPSVISIGILSFGAQNVVPSILGYLGNDPVKSKRAIIGGCLIPLCLYCLWEGVILGMVDSSTATVVSGMNVDDVLRQAGGPVVGDLLELFSLSAIGSSMTGASLSLVDFVEDALRELQQNDKGTRFRLRTVAIILALLPPCAIALGFKDVFLVALEEAGLLGGVSLYGIIPALCILSLRRTFKEEMPGRIGGGNTSLVAIVAVSTLLISPEVVMLLRKL